MPDIDLFNFFRWWLGLIVTIYASIITFQSMYGWYLWLAGQDKYIGLLRRYLIVHGLRLRFRTFWGDVIISVLLTVAFLIMWRAHYLIQETGNQLRASREIDRKTLVLHDRREASRHEHEQQRAE